jgi:predicted acylesterase/phospholipase RssA
MQDKNKRIVLSGGGIKGILQLGSIYYLIENDYLVLSEIKGYYGTSIGAVISIFLIIGYDPITLLQYLFSNKILTGGEINLVDILSTGLYDWDILGQHISKLINEKLNFIPTLNQLYEMFPIDFVCSTYNYTKRKLEYISYRTHPNLSILKALQMTTSLPFLFSKCKYENDIYIDGGIADNFMVEYCVKENKKGEIIGIQIQDSINEFISSSKIKNILNDIYQLYSIPLMLLQEYKTETVKNDAFIISLSSDLKLVDFNLNTKNILQYFCNGYSQTKKQINIY